MATTITKGYTFDTTELVTAAKLHSLVDSATVTGLAATDIDMSDFVIYSGEIITHEIKVNDIATSAELVYYV